MRGEAGIGKSTLVAALRRAAAADARLLVGHCDDLATARVLGPLRDLAPSAARSWRTRCARATTATGSTRRSWPS